MIDLLYKCIIFDKICNKYNGFNSFFDNNFEIHSLKYKKKD